MIKGVHLTVLMGPVVPVPVPAEVTDAIDNVTVTVNSGQRSGFQIAFRAGKESIIHNILIPSGLFDPGIRAVLVATVNGIPTVLMDGVVTRQEVAPSSKPGQSTVTLTGEDVSVMMDVDKTLRLPYPNMPAAARVAFIIAKYARFGMIPLVIPELFPNVPLVLNEIPIGQGSDLEYVKKLAEDNGYVFYVEPGPVPGTNIAYFGPEIRIGIPQPALSINMDAASNVETLSFSFDGLSRTQKVVKIQEPLTKISIPIPLPDISVFAPPLGLRQAPSLKTEVLEGTAAENPIAAMARGLAKVSDSADAITGSGTLDVLRYGSVLRARGLVGVRGAGIGYDGLYYVKSVTHKLKRGEYKQNFSLVRNGLVPTVPAVPV